MAMIIILEEAVVDKDKEWSEEKLSMERMIQHQIRNRRYNGGRTRLGKVFGKLKKSLPKEYKEKLPDRYFFIEDTAYPGEQKPDRPLFYRDYDLEPKKEFFTAVSQFYKNAGMENEAVETMKHCEEWISKYTFDGPNLY